MYCNSLNIIFSVTTNGVPSKHVQNVNSCWWLNYKLTHTYLYYKWRETDCNFFIFLSLCFPLRQKQIKNNDGKTQHNKLRHDGGGGGKMSLNGRKRGFRALNFRLITCVFIGTEIGIGMHNAYTVSTECHSLLFPLVHCTAPSVRKRHQFPLNPHFCNCVCLLPSPVI